MTIGEEINMLYELMKKCREEGLKRECQIIERLLDNAMDRLQEKELENA